MSKTRRKVHEDEYGPYVVYTGNVYRPRYRTQYGAGCTVKVTPTKSLRSAVVGSESWMLAEEDILWRSDGLIR